jgi:uncharacterized circularly permuted ATP-grasp superfamily protein
MSLDFKQYDTACFYDELFAGPGITFTVYGSEEGAAKIFPFDIVPRILEARDWSFIGRVLKQRIHG